MSQSRIAVYAGSFDPITNGHMYILRQGAELFDTLVAAVGSNPEKKYDFSVEERMDLIRKSAGNIPNFKVDHFEEEYVVNFAARLGATHLVRGIRHEDDFQLERTMRHVNEDIHPGITTVYFMPPRSLSEVSSSFIKGLVGPKGWEKVVAKYVPAPVLEALRRVHGAKDGGRKG